MKNYIKPEITELTVDIEDIVASSTVSDTKGHNTDYLGGFSDSWFKN